MLSGRIEAVMMMRQVAAILGMDVTDHRLLVCHAECGAAHLRGYP